MHAARLVCPLQTCVDELKVALVQVAHGGDKPGNCTWAPGMCCCFFGTPAGGLGFKLQGVSFGF